MLSSLEKYNAKFDRVMYIISLKSNITYVFSHNFAEIKIDSDDGFSLEEMLTFSFWQCYYNILLEKRSYQITKK